MNLQDYLELTSEQRQHWQQLSLAFAEVSANWNAIRKHREALVRHIFAAAPDRQAIDAEQAAIARLQAEQQQRVIAQLLAERALFNEAQRVRLMELLLRYAQELRGRTCCIASEILRLHKSLEHLARGSLKKAVQAAWRTNLCSIF